MFHMRFFVMTIDEHFVIHERKEGTKKNEKV